MISIDPKSGFVGGERAAENRVVRAVADVNGGAVGEAGDFRRDDGVVAAVVNVMIGGRRVTVDAQLNSDFRRDVISRIAVANVSVDGRVGERVVKAAIKQNADAAARGNPNLSVLHSVALDELKRVSAAGLGGE